MMKEKIIQKGRSEMLLKRLLVSVLSLVFLLSSVYLNSMTVHAAEADWVHYDFNGKELWYDSNSNITINTEELKCNEGDGGHFKYDIFMGWEKQETCAHIVTSDPTTPISGDVSIDGTTEVGQTLSVNYTGGNSSEVGSHITYMWFRDDTIICVPPSSTYTLVADDKDHKIKVKITGTGAYSGSLESAQTSTVTEAAPTPTPPSGGPEQESAASDSSSSSETKEETKSVDPVSERIALENAMEVEPVKIDTTQFKKGDSNVVPEIAYNLSNFFTTSGIVKGINAAVADANKTDSAEAEIYSGYPLCFNNAILKAINDGKTDIVYYFVYQEHLYSITIPATVDATTILAEAPFAGPLYVGQQLGTTKLLK